MRQSVRFLGWTVTISTLILFAFLVTAVYSIFQTVLMEQGIRLGEVQPQFTNDTLVLSIPITINNTGYYDVNEFNITTVLSNVNGTSLMAKSVVIQEISRGQAATRLFNLSMSLSDILTNMTYFLFNDTDFKIDFFVGFKYASAFALQLAVRNTSMPWGAPLYGLTLREVRMASFNATHLTLDVYLDLENHSFFNISGNVYLKVYNQAEGYIGSGRGAVNVPSNSRLNAPTQATIVIENPMNFTGRGSVEICLEIPQYNYTLALGRASYG